METAVVLDGREIAKKSLEALRADIKRIGVSLKLATVRVGDAEDARLYSKAIDAFLAKVGVQHAKSEFPETIAEDKLIAEIKKLSADRSVNTIMLFSPLPKGLNARSVRQAVSVWKDIENWSSRLVRENGRLIAPPTAEAVMVLVKEACKDLEGKEAVVVGRSDTVGLPVSILLIKERVTVAACNSKTPDLRSYVGRADILVAAAGQPALIKGAWIKPGAVVIDVGEPVGDVEFEEAKKRAAFITPVPGGVGPLTNVMLVQNVVDLYEIGKKSNGNP
ncbi:MAG: bifunctional 5,10-methylenetetrahydrofolate dehydrogenase/5,10-methenyltetrahydrofolate cyclohydrolase [Candidatus Omnitrophota bacterium]